MPTEHLIYYRTSGGDKKIVGSPPQTSSAGPGGGGSSVTTRGWRSTLKRMTRRDEVTGFGAAHYQVWQGITAQHDPAAFFPLMPPNNMIYRVRGGIAAEYVSGTGVSRVGFGVMKNWKETLLGAPAALLDPGFIGFLWYQSGSTSVNWRAVAGNHAGDNKFDQDTGQTAPDVPYNMRIDFDGRIGKRVITWFIDEKQVASFTPGDDVLGGGDVARMRMGLGVNSQNGNVCAGHSEMLGQIGWELMVQEGL